MPIQYLLLQMLKARPWTDLEARAGVALVGPERDGQGDQGGGGGMFGLMTALHKRTRQVRPAPAYTAAAVC